MNALFRKKTSLIAAMAILPLAGACSSAFSSRIDEASPLAPRIQTLVDANRHYPQWRDFPAAPQALPDVGQVAANVQGLQGQGTTLNGEVARIEWTLGDPEAMAADARARVGSVPQSPDAVRSQADIDAFAKSLRDRAKAPPPIDRRPAQ